MVYLINHSKLKYP